MFHLVDKRRKRKSKTGELFKQVCKLIIILVNKIMYNNIVIPSLLNEITQHTLIVHFVTITANSPNYITSTCTPHLQVRSLSLSGHRALFKKCVVTFMCSSWQMNGLMPASSILLPPLITKFFMQCIWFVKDVFSGECTATSYVFIATTSNYINLHQTTSCKTPLRILSNLQYCMYVPIATTWKRILQSLFNKKKH